MPSLPSARAIAALLCAFAACAVAQQSTEAYELPPMHCETFSKTVVQLGSMQDPTHPIWNATPAIKAQILQAALSDAVEGLSVTTKLTFCDVAKYNATTSSDAAPPTSA